MRKVHNVQHDCVLLPGIGSKLFRGYLTFQIRILPTASRIWMPPSMRGNGCVGHTLETDVKGNMGQFFWPKINVLMKT